MKIINFEKKKMIPLKNEQQESYEKAKYATLQKKLEHKYNMIKIWQSQILLSLY